MTEASTAGLFLVLLGGFFQGTFMLPSKGMRGWRWENYWLIFAATAYLVSPWALAFATVERLGDVYRGASAGALISILLYGLGWGLGALTFGIGVDSVGMALGFAVILGIAATSGTLVPLAFLATEGFSVSQGMATAAALAVMLLGVATVSFAGRWKEKDAQGRPYARGIAICIVSGLLSACGNLGFAFGGEISRRAEQLGNPEHVATNALWTLLAFPLFVCNAGYAGLMLRRHDTGSFYRAAGSSRRFLLAVSMGVMWMAGFWLYGMGARKLGALGPSLGWAMLMSSMVLVANGWGVLTGEWKGAPAPAVRQLVLGLLLLIAAIWGLGYANTL